MKKYTIADFESFEIVDGRTVCPTGDYTAIGKIPEDCSFGEGCRFGKGCSFGEGCRFGKDCRFENNKEIISYIAIDRIGSENRKTYFYYTAEKEIYVRAGCYFGTLAEFENRVKERHGDNKHGKAYKKAIEYAKYVIQEVG